MIHGLKNHAIGTPSKRPRRLKRDPCVRSAVRESIRLSASSCPKETRFFDGYFLASILADWCIAIYKDSSTPRLVCRGPKLLRWIELPMPNTNEGRYSGLMLNAISSIIIAIGEIDKGLPRAKTE